MRPFTRVTSRTVVLAAANIDTDQIIPARFLTTTTRDGLGRQLFADWRYDAAGAPRAEFALNRPEAKGAQLLVAGRNFGCGSSREHAPWALMDHGFRAVISTEIADIFRNNALKNGPLPVIVEEPVSPCLLAHPGALPDGTVARFPLEAFAQQCLLEGVDQLGYLLARAREIETYERRA
jgi:3-isopropylmalate/(R)-2-methylmalate dehydratase small subunit